MEVWKDIKGFEDKYQVSNTGKVRSLNFNNTGKVRELKLNINKHTNLAQVSLSKNNKKYDFMVARLVAEHFIPNRNKKPIVMHIGIDTTDNSVENLKWAYISEVKFAMYKKGRRKVGTPSDYVFSYKGKKYKKINEIADDYNLSRKQFSHRFYNGWTLEETVSIPIQPIKHGGRPRRCFEYKGKIYSIKQLAEIAGISERALDKRLRTNWDVESAVEIPIATSMQRRGK